MGVGEDGNGAPGEKKKRATSSCARLQPPPPPPLALHFLSPFYVCLAHRARAQALGEGAAGGAPAPPKVAAGHSIFSLRFRATPVFGRVVGPVFTFFFRLFSFSSKTTFTAAMATLLRAPAALRVPTARAVRACGREKERGGGAWERGAA